VEAAIKRLNEEETREFLLPQNPKTVSDPVRERLRRSRLYLPGNDPKLAINAGIHHPDGVILDLEDSVAPPEKDAARILVRNTLRAVDFYGAEPMVRINQLPLGLRDLEAVVPHGVHVVLIPKCESGEQVIAVDAKIAQVREGCGRTDPVFLMPIIESALGAFKALEIATASKNNVALTIGLEDYTADIGTSRTLEGRESFWARSMVVNAARAAGLQPIDTVFSDVDDEEGLRNSVTEAKSLGFEGKGLIHPRQIQPVHDAFAPTIAELEKAQRIVDAFENAQAQGLAVVSLGSKMIDPPVVKRAQFTLKMAQAAGMNAGGEEA
jgi:citrate lyase subunit beta/citryl-CoA lyase